MRADSVKPFVPPSFRSITALYRVERVAMDLFEQAGMKLEKRPIERSEADERDDPEFTSRELLHLMDMPVGNLADWYYSFVDIDPMGRLSKSKQLRRIVHDRKLTLPELGAAWEKLRDEVNRPWMT